MSDQTNLVEPYEISSTCHEKLGSPFDRIPDELLEWIVKSIGSMFRISSDEASGRRNWHACALVCKRWYNIALPHLFRVILISSNAPGSLSDFHDMILHNTAVAQHVERLSITFVDVHVSVLAATLKKLPKLRVLGLWPSTIQPSMDEQSLRGNIKLSAFQYEIPVRVAFRTRTVCPSESLDCQRATLQLLGLFSEIGYLYLRTRSEYITRYEAGDGPECELGSAPQFLHSLKFQAVDIGSFGEQEMTYVTILNQLDGFRNLTDLRVHPDSLLGLRNLGKQLCLHAPTLSHLMIFFWCNRAKEFKIPHNFDEYMTPIREGLSACVNLRVCAVSMNSQLRVEPRQRLPRVSGRAVESIAHEWKFLLEIVALLPDDLSELILSYNLKETSFPDLHYGYDELPWSIIRERCRRFRNSSSISVEFAYEYNEENQARDEVARIADHEIRWQKCAGREMKEFEDILKFGGQN